MWIRRQLAGRLIALAVASGAALACSGEKPPGDILLITIDTLRADHLGLYGYGRATSPEIDRIFARGAIFEHAYATSAYTSASVASLLTGRLPQDHGVRLFDQIFPGDLVLLSGLLSGYQTAAFVSTRILSNDATGMAKRFEYFDDHIERREDVGLRERPAGPTTDAVLAWLRTSRDPTRPLFLWVHYKDPHAPYRPPDGESRGFHHQAPSHLDPARVPLQARIEGVEDPIEYIDRYDEEIAYTDAQVGRLLDGYAALRPLDDALLIFTADHGETLVERRLWFSHAYHVFEEIVRVPLLLRGPGVVGGRHAGLSSGIDIAPTILRFAGKSAGEGFDGMDLRAPQRIPSQRTIFVESAPAATGHQWRAALRGDHKWVLKVRADGVRERRFYDLAADPAERRPAAWVDDDATAHTLLRLVESDPDPAGRPADAKRGSLEDELLERLGYAR
jgi:arylsulfatase